MFYSRAELSRLTGLTKRQVQWACEQGLLSQDLDSSRLEDWRIAARLLSRRVRLDLIAQVIEAKRASAGRFLIVDRDHQKVLAMHTATEVLRKLAAGDGRWMLIDLGR